MYGSIAIFFVWMFHNNSSPFLGFFPLQVFKYPQTPLIFAPRVHSKNSNLDVGVLILPAALQSTRMHIFKRVACIFFKLPMNGQVFFYHLEISIKFLNEKKVVFSRLITNYWSVYLSLVCSK